MKIGIGIPCWNRPEMLKQSLTSLSKNNLENVDVHVFQEGELCHIHGDKRTDLGSIGANKAIFDSIELPHKEWHQHEKHIGCGLQLLEINNFLSEWYDGFVFMEDDVTVSEHALVIIDKLLEQFGNDETIGMINPGMMLRCKPEEVHNNFDTVIIDEGRTSRICIEAMTPQMWNKTLPNFQEYLNLVSDVSGFDVGNYEIRNRVTSWVMSQFSSMIEPSSDTAIIRSILLSGRKRMFLTVNRSTNIGDWGLNCNPEVLASLGDGHQPIYESEEELHIKEFRIKQ
jgi:hypothetical protein